MYGHGERLTFGKYKGRRVADVPLNYLRWCLRECECLDPPLRRAIEAEVYRRTGDVPGGDGATGGTAPGGPVAQWEPVLRQWYHGLALKYHPDRGGSTRDMQVVNHAAEELRRLLGVA